MMHGRRSCWLKLEAKVVLVDLFFVIAVGSCRVMTQVGAAGRVAFAQLLGLSGGHVQASTSLDDLGGLLKTLEHLEHRGELADGVVKTSWPL